MNDIEFAYRLGRLDESIDLGQRLEPTLQELADAIAATIAEARDLVAVVNEVKP